jgi:hypothetical protein
MALREITAKEVVDFISAHEGVGMDEAIRAIRKQDALRALKNCHTFTALLDIVRGIIEGDIPCA